MKKSIYKIMYGECHMLNIESIPFKIKNEARVPSITTSIPTSIIHLSQCSKTRKRKRATKIEKEETNKQSLFADDIIFCVDSLKEFTGKLFEWMKELSKFADYKTIQKVSTFP